MILLVEHPERLLTSGDWYGVFGDGALLVRQADFGALQERRLRRCDGLVVEVNIGSLSWATTGPVESGTRRVVEDGLVPLLDPVGRLHDLVRAVLGGRCG